MQLYNDYVWFYLTGQFFQTMCQIKSPKIHPPVSTFAVEWTSKHFQIPFILHILQWNKYVARRCTTNGGFTF